MTEAVVEVRGLRKTFRVTEREEGLAATLRSFVNRRRTDVNAVAGITFRIDAGEVVGFLGPNGAGKTTTVRMLAALIAPTDGDAIVGGHVLGVDDTALRGSVGILTEQPGLYDRLSARQNLRYFARLYDLDVERADSQVERYLHLLELWERRDEPVGTFSKGMRQKLAIARALLRHPHLLVFDEATSALDSESELLVQEALAGVRSDVEAGASLAQAMERQPKVFDRLFRSMVRSGEQSGRLEEALERIREALNDGLPARSVEWDERPPVLREINLLTAKPMLYVANVDEAQITDPGPMAHAVFAHANNENSRAIAFNGKIESEFAGMSDDDVAEFRSDYGITSGGLDRLIVQAYDLLGLMTFLTTGPKETRAWTIEKGTKAPQAAGKIHTDIERGFIRAEIVSYADYVTYETMDAVRAAGKLRSEGKDYVMQEGDVVEFRFNV